MRVIRVFADDDGESHFEDRDIHMGDVAYGRASQQLPATALIFRETDTGGGLDFHNPPRRQFIIFLTGSAELQASDGSTRRLGPGDVLMADDTTGRGHRLREVEGRTLAFVPLPDDFDVDSYLQAL
jgi:hypothetical protein